MKKARLDGSSCVSSRNKGLEHGNKLTWTRAVSEWLGSSVGSICIHCVAIFLLFCLFRSNSSDGVAGNARDTDDVGIVLRETLDESELNVKTSDSTETESVRELIERSESRQDAPTTSAHDLVESFLPSNEIGVNSPKATSLQSVLRSSQLNATSSNSGQRVSFGGVSGTGRRFAYVVDHSESMNWGGGAPLRCAVAEATESIKSLDAKQGAAKFQVIIFNHESEVFENGKALIDVNAANKERAARFLRSVVATGGTAPEQALELAIRQKPDVIFFLTDTDEELTDLSLERIHTLRRQFKVSQICVVEFGRSTALPKSSFKKLAGENGGSYSFKDIDSM